MKRLWLVLHYQLEREPSAPRVSLWRKLKKLGAVLVQDTLWVLPENARNREYFRWLCAEILEHGGKASLWTAESVLAGQDLNLERLFLEPIEAGYQHILEALRGQQPDLAALAKQFQMLQAQDHLHCELGQQARLALAQKEQT
jgi:hypothetical protein